MSATHGSSIARAVLALALAGGIYVSALLVRFFYPPHVERFRLESGFMIFVAAAVALVLVRPGGVRQGLSAARPVGSSTASAAGGVFIGFTLLLYWPALGVGLLSDDFVIADFAVRGQWVYGLDVAYARPVVPALWSVLLAMPASETVLHAANLALHAFNAMLVVILAGRWRMTRDQALAAGMLFVMWPGLTEAIVWTSGMHDVLMTTFVLAALIAVLRADEHPVWAAGAVGLALLAMSSKETGVVVPVLGWGLWLAAAPRPRGSRPMLTLAAVTLVAVIFAIVRLAAVVPEGYDREVSRYFLKQLLVDPYAVLGAPWSRDWARANPFVGLERALVIVALILVAALSWRRQSPGLRRAIASGAWVVIAVLPVYSMFHVAANLEGSRYVYLPAAGFALLLASLVGAAARAVPGYLAAPTIGVLVVVLAGPSAAAIPDEVGRWHAAARTRDLVLAGLRSHPAAAECSSFQAEGPADNVDGAFVFRNGLSQALGHDPDKLGPECAVEWDGESAKIGRLP